MTFRGTPDGIIQTLDESVLDYHVVIFPYRGGETRVALNGREMAWLGGTGQRKTTSIDVSGKLTAIYLLCYGWVRGELNSTAYFDKNGQLMYTGPLLQCRLCAIRGVISHHISCRMCLPLNHGVVYGIILGTYTGSCYIVDSEEGKCEFVPHGPKDPSTLLRRASRLTKSSNNYRRAISISGLSSSTDLTLAFFAVYPIASFSFYARVQVKLFSNKSPKSENLDR